MSSTMETRLAAAQLERNWSGDMSGILDYSELDCEDMAWEMEHYAPAYDRGEEVWYPVPIRKLDDYDICLWRWRNARRL